MSDEKLDFMQMLSTIKTTDDDDRVKTFKDCIEQNFETVSRKVAEYKRDGKLTIEIKFLPDKKNKNEVKVSADIKKTIPKGITYNSFYSDARTGGLYFDDPNQLKMFKSNVTQITDKDAAANNND